MGVCENVNVADNLPPKTKIPQDLPLRGQRRAKRPERWPIELRPQECTVIQGGHDSAQIWHCTVNSYEGCKIKPFTTQYLKTMDRACLRELCGRLDDGGLPRKRIPTGSCWAPFAIFLTSTDFPFRFTISSRLSLTLDFYNTILIFELFRLGAPLIWRPHWGEGELGVGPKAKVLVSCVSSTVMARGGTYCKSETFADAI